MDLFEIWGPYMERMAFVRLSVCNMHVSVQFPYTDPRFASSNDGLTERVDGIAYNTRLGAALEGGFMARDPLSSQSEPTRMPAMDEPVNASPACTPAPAGAYAANAEGLHNGDKVQVELRINNNDYRLQVDPRTTLLD